MFDCAVYTEKMLSSKQTLQISLVFLFALLGSGCRSSSEITINKEIDCEHPQIFSHQTQTCALPRSADEAAAILTWNELDDLRTRGDAPVTVDLKYSHPVMREVFSKTLAATRPTMVDNIGFFFPNIEGGMTVGADTKGASVSIEALFDRANQTIQAKYAPFAQYNQKLSMYPIKYKTEIDSNKEQYTELILEARPSDLLAAWGQIPEILYINTQQ